MFVPVKSTPKNTQFGNVMRSRGLGHKKKWVAAKKLGPYYCCSGKGLLGDLDAWSRECGIDCCRDLHHRLFHVVPGSMEGKAATSVTEENNLSPLRTKHYKNMHRGVLPCVLFQSFSNMGTDVCKLIVSWKKAVVQLYVVC